MATQCILSVAVANATHRYIPTFRQKFPQFGFEPGKLPLIALVLDHQHLDFFGFDQEGRLVHRSPSNLRLSTRAVQGLFLCWALRKFLRSETIERCGFGRRWLLPSRHVPIRWLARRTSPEGMPVQAFLPETRWEPKRQNSGCIRAAQPQDGQAGNARPFSAGGAVSGTAPSPFVAQDTVRVSGTAWITRPRTGLPRPGRRRCTWCRRRTWSRGACPRSGRGRPCGRPTCRTGGRWRSRRH